MRKSLRVIFWLLLILPASGAWAQTVFINEIHYDTESTDANEGIEIAGPAGTDLTNWSLVLYNGNNGEVYKTTGLSGMLTAQQGGYGTLFFPITGIQNGSPDGIALVDATGNLLQFISYEGSMTAIGGPANGLTSEDIEINESAAPTGTSLQLTGEGTEYIHFSWASSMPNTYNNPNTNQTFTGSDDGGSDGGGEDPTEPAEPNQTIVFINEIHYDNDGTDIEEGIEIAALSGTDLTGWSIILYNGNNGAAYKTVNLNGIVEDQQAGFGTVFFPITGLQNGSPDGIALINQDSEVVQFLSYEGSFVAVGGLADGMSSIDIEVAEASSTPINYSLQLSGEGSAYADFTWSAAQPSTYNAVNSNQTFLPVEPIVFINEIHYDNSGSDTNEGIEIAGTAGTDLSAYSIVLYNGNNGAVYNTTTLSGELPNQDNGYGALFFSISGIQNGSPDGIALIRNETQEVIQFISYEGNMTAIGGPADGMSSEDIGVSQSGSPVGQTLQLKGEGKKYEDFTWEGPLAGTPNQINQNQSFGGEVVSPEPEELEMTIAEARQLQIGRQVIVEGVLTVTGQHGGPAFIQDSTAGIALYDNMIHANDTLQIGDVIRVQATIGTFNEQIQLIEVSEYELISQNNEPVNPRVVTIDQLNDVEGQLVTIENVSFTNTGGLLFPNSNYGISDASGSSEVRIDDNVESLIGRYIPQGETSITGVVGSFRGNMQILPRFEEDMPGTAPYVQEGSEIPAALTFDIATWNMEFFGSTLATYGPTDVQLQMENAVKVIEAMDVDIVAVQEISDEAMLQLVAERLEGNWAIRCSDVYSYSFEPADPNFPAQKLCYLYNTDVIEVISERVVFDEFYTQIRTSGNTDLLPGYPTSAGSFWASGRLPYELSVRATANGITQEVSLFNIHGISNTGGETNYQRRMYDIRVLKDTLDTYYQDKAVIILGDYNDDVDEPVYAGASSNVSPYAVFVEDEAYVVPTKSLTDAGFRSYITQENMIDHITITDELISEWIEGSEATFIPFTVVENYLGTTSDHLPVKVRFELEETFDPIELTLDGDLQVFYGYEPEACTTLSVQAIGGNGEYSYSWSNGAYGSSIEVCPSETEVFTVTVSDTKGNSATAEVQVCAVDVRCGNPRGKAKIELCYKVGRKQKPVALCLPEDLAPFFLQRGALLGSCAEQDACIPEANERNNEVNARESFDTQEVETYSIDDVLTVRHNLRAGTAKVDFVVLEEGQSSLDLYNAAGQKVRELYRGQDEFGTFKTIELNDHSLQNGIYYIQMQTASGAVFRKKLML